MDLSAQLDRIRRAISLVLHSNFSGVMSEFSVTKFKRPDEFRGIKSEKTILRMYVPIQFCLCYHRKRDGCSSDMTKHIPNRGHRHVVVMHPQNTHKV